MQYKIPEIAAITNGKHVGNNANCNTLITRFFTDSRQQGDKSTAMFVALSGERHNGHNYIEGLYLSGFRNFIVSKDFCLSNIYDANIIVVDDTLAALKSIAANYRSTFKFPVLGITGSNGKTLVKEWIYQILQSFGTITRSPKSYNSQVGVPLSVLMANETADIGVFEAGISTPNEMQKLESILNPEIGIFANIGDAHQENFIDIEQKVNEKLKLFEHSKLLIYCRNHDIIHNAVSDKT